MSPLRFENIAEGNDAESRVRNLILAAERGGMELADAVDAFRWAARNWLHARRRLGQIDAECGDRDMRVIAREGLEVQDDV